ncbi:WD40/YVTN/BNR-like repeat-containing protein [Virgisporangium ochraceum]|uniref:Uncharacterized protein n=1 Tax=Virgisporangium ochraceum TaxID=65505 RepID=A0A8J4E8G5_9ACTN|nr:hypothetical protein [Virgisporangium ochraceum]GIJ66145.1 hypothetical protein Voc01_010620 [Virgisporangium ochraceum]
MSDRLPLRRTVAVVAAAVVVLASGACGPKKKPIDDARERGSAASAGPVERHSELTVREGLRPQVLEFANAYTGYVLFSGCSQECRGALFVTFDGGQSWVERTLPFERAEAARLWLVDADTIIVASQPLGWFRSSDAGRTFVRGGDGEPAPAEYLRGPGVGCVDQQQECTPVLLMDGRPAPTQPPLDGGLRGVDRAPDGTLLAVAASGTSVAAAASRDDGRSWAPLGEPVTVPAADSVRLSVSPDGRDVWLVANGTDTLSAYRWDEGEWREVKRGIALPTRLGGAVALGGGVLAVACSRFSYLHFDGHFHHSDRPMNAVSVRRLGDGTVLTSVAPWDVWLGSGSGGIRVWNRVTVDARWR